MLLGIWDNYEHLEECLSMAELEAILLASRNREKRQQVFAAALKGIDLNKDEDLEQRRKEIEMRAQARIAGVELEDYRNMTLQDIGIEITQE